MKVMYLIGQGNDTHELAEMKNATIKLGGCSIKTHWRVISFSDGDVVLHTIANAILGALQLGDIGLYFPDNKTRNKGIDSIKIINFAIDRLKKAKYKLVNIDLTITCENILLGSNKALIQKSLAKILHTKLINVKATRFEHPSNHIKCDAVLLVKK